ncbi:hypothetical protein MKZ38_001887 [Zalerion maritima]|uniref:Uncharacterized protein n=1 Tax=Zalerion maritima TaxID=339359 RepID=A0AAD5RPS8_9PEZI|nr:hypothetical protein MKZ38_001887 [Zalerion maritima]
MCKQFTGQSRPAPVMPLNPSEPPDDAVKRLRHEIRTAFEMGMVSIIPTINFTFPQAKKYLCEQAGDFSEDSRLAVTIHTDPFPTRPTVPQQQKPAKPTKEPAKPPAKNLPAAKFGMKPKLTKKQQQKKEKEAKKKAKEEKEKAKQPPPPAARAPFPPPLFPPPTLPPPPPPPLHPPASFPLRPKPNTTPGICGLDDGETRWVITMDTTNRLSERVRDILMDFMQNTIEERVKPPGRERIITPAELGWRLRVHFPNVEEGVGQDLWHDYLASVKRMVNMEILIKKCGRRDPDEVETEEREETGGGWEKRQKKDSGLEAWQLGVDVIERLTKAAGEIRKGSSAEAKEPRAGKQSKEKESESTEPAMEIKSVAAKTNNPVVPKGLKAVTFKIPTKQVLAMSKSQTETPGEGNLLIPENIVKIVRMQKPEKKGQVEPKTQEVGSSSTAKKKETSPTDERLGDIMAQISLRVKKNQAMIKEIRELVEQAGEKTEKKQDDGDERDKEATEREAGGDLEAAMQTLDIDDWEPRGQGKDKKKGSVEVKEVSPDSDDEIYDIYS